MLKKEPFGEFFESPDLYVFFGNKNFSNTSSTFNKNSLLFGKQCHEDQLLGVDSIKNLGSSTMTNSSDGLRTKTPNKKLGIYTADCVPCFIFDGEALMSLHLGWRSLQMGLLDKAILKLSQNFKNRSLKIFAGPHIQYDSFEVGNEVVEAFKKTMTEPSHKWSKPSSNSNLNPKYLISLRQIIEFKALKSNAHLVFSESDTLTSSLHHSYRGDEGTNSRNISFAFIKNRV